MLKLLKTGFMTVACLVLLSACGSSYNTDLPAPANNISIADTFPVTIAGQARALKRLPEVPGMLGAQSTYGAGKASIKLWKAKDASQANAYFKDKIVPSFDKMPTHSRAQVNGHWYASGKSDKLVAYGWVNQSWIFVIQAADQKMFDDVIKEFKYIAAK